MRIDDIPQVDAGPWLRLDRRVHADEASQRRWSESPEAAQAAHDALLAALIEAERPSMIVWRDRPTLEKHRNRPLWAVYGRLALVR